MYFYKPKLWMLAASISTITTAANLSHAAGISNGDFQTGDFTGWSLDTDGLPGGTPDFSILNNAGDFTTRIEADYPGDALWVANTLYQDLDLSAASGDSIRLSFDWKFFGEAAVPDEVFNVALGKVSMLSGALEYYDANGNPGFLLSETNYGAGSFSAVLDAGFVNVVGWSLDFQMLLGNQFDFMGSYALIDNVALEIVQEQPQPSNPSSVPVPPALLLFSTGLFGLSVWQNSKFKAV